MKEFWINVYIHENIKIYGLPHGDRYPSPCDLILAYRIHVKLK